MIHLFSDIKSGVLTPEGRRFEAYINDLCARRVLVGFQSEPHDERESSGPTLAEVAAWNEFGTDRAPSRPFMRQTVNDYAEQIAKFGKSKVAAGGAMDARQTLNAMGSYVKGCIQKEIINGEFEPNAASTIAKKDSDKPLIDTGRMRQNVNYVIR